MILKAESPDSASLVVEVKPSSPTNDEEVLMQVDEQAETGQRKGDWTQSLQGALGLLGVQAHMRSPLKGLGPPSPADLRPTSASLTGHAVINQRVQSHCGQVLQVKSEGAVTSKDDTHILLKSELKTEPPEVSDPVTSTPNISVDIPHSSSAHPGTYECHTPLRLQKTAFLPLWISGPKHFEALEQYGKYSEFVVAFRDL